LQKQPVFVMRYALPIALAAIMAVPTSAQNMPAESDGTYALVGTWEMVSQREVYPDTTIDRGRFLGPSYKILNKTHFAFGRQRIIGGVVQDDVFAGGGRYSFDGKSSYVEYVEYHESAPNVGLTIEFDCQLQGDSLWYHTGTIGEMRLEEVWKRVE
jgi:hypothetical protein